MRNGKSIFFFFTLFVMLWYTVYPFNGKKSFYLNIERMKPGDTYIHEIVLNQDSTYQFSVFTEFVSGDIDFYNKLKYEFILNEEVISSGSIADANLKTIKIDYHDKSKLYLALHFPDSDSNEYNDKNLKFTFKINYRELQYISYVNGVYVFLLALSLLCMNLQYKQNSFLSHRHHNILI